MLSFQCTHDLNYTGRRLAILCNVVYLVFMHVSNGFFFLKSAIARILYFNVSIKNDKFTKNEKNEIGQFSFD